MGCRKLSQGGINMSQMVVRCGGKVVMGEAEFTPVTSKYTGELETFRQKAVKFMTNMFIPVTIATKWAFTHKEAFAQSVDGATRIREGFEVLLDTFTALAEPVLWFYALVGCIMIATGKNKEKGMDRLKQVGYAYIAISLLPTMFALLRWIGEIIKGAITF
jgi:hypothetical protein